MQTERGWKGGGIFPPPLRWPPKQCAVVRAPAQCKGCYQLASGPTEGESGEEAFKGKNKPNF